MKKYLLLIILPVLFSLTLKKTQAATSTDPNLKVAFIGDSSAGTNFQNVLNLIKAEQAQLVLHQGDFDYDNGPQLWMDKINNTLGASFPYLGSDGNHDNWDSDGYAAFFKNKLLGIGVNSVNVPAPSYSIVYKGLKIVFAKENGDTAFINSQLTGDTHTWKICSWHKNQNSMQVGEKGNEQGWGDYEACRKLGAIIATGHEHSYERTKTLTNTQTQTVDSTCSDPKKVCVSPGRTFAFVSGLGGNSIRFQARCTPTTYPYGCKQEWASIYTSDQGAKYGALFIIFNYNGNPNLAHGYFKNISGQIIDEFDINATAGSVGSSPTVAPNNPTPTRTPTPIVKSPTPIPGSKPGDANGDNLVDGLDYVAWLNSYDRGIGGIANGDFDNSGNADGLDYVIWLNNYGT